MWILANFNGSGTDFVQQFLSHRFALERVIDVFWNVKYARHEALFTICNAIRDERLEIANEIY